MVKSRESSSTELRGEKNRCHGIRHPVRGQNGRNTRDNRARIRHMRS